jgi:ABC-2 type transport system permease protein
MAMTNEATTLAPERTLVKMGAMPRGLPKLASEFWTLYLRQLKRLSRTPMIIFFSLIQPMIWLVLFGQMFSRITSLPGAAQQFGNVSYLQFFMPAVILQSILFGAGQAGVGIIMDIDSGFLDKLLTTPVNRFAILFGRVGGDLTRMLVQSVIVVLVGWIFGFFQTPPVNFYYGLPGVIGALLLAMLFGLVLAGLNVYIALRTRNTETTFMLGSFLTLPLLFVSSAQLPITLLPEWMQTIAKFNPVTYAVDGMRVLLNGPAAVSSREPLAAVLLAVVILGVLAAITVTLATRQFRRAVG